MEIKDGRAWERREDPRRVENVGVVGNIFQGRVGKDADEETRLARKHNVDKIQRCASSAARRSIDGGQWVRQRHKEGDERCMDEGIGPSRRLVRKDAGSVGNVDGWDKTSESVMLGSTVSTKNGKKCRSNNKNEGARTRGCRRNMDGRIH